MQPIIDVLKVTIRPTSITFVVMVLALGVLLSFLPRIRRIARWYFVAALLGFWIFSTPACAERLVETSARDFLPLRRAADARGASIVVVLGGGHRVWRVGDVTLNMTSDGSALRVIEAARLYHLLDHPTIILSGGRTGADPEAPPESEAMRDAIVGLGVPLDHLVLESESETTRDEAVIIRRMLADRGRQPIVVVTSPMHMRRSLAVFRAMGLDPVPSACAYKSDRSLQHLRWLPNDTAFLLFDTFLYDKAANLYYMIRGLLPAGTGADRR